ncbi:MAG: HDOD domain-containing protein [Gaiellaceae bacterium]
MRSRLRHSGSVSVVNPRPAEPITGTLDGRIEDVAPRIDALDAYDEAELMSDGAASSVRDRLIELAREVQPLPASVPRLGAVIGSEQAEVDTVCAVLRDDPGLVAAVLREANSATSAARDPIETIDTAVIRLGLARVLAIAVNQSAQSELSTAALAYGLGEGILYRHSIAVSHVAEVLRPLSPVSLGPEVVTCALLHDIGMIVLAQVLDRQGLDVALAEHARLVHAERSLVDIDHAELGSDLAALWKLPDSVAAGIRHHHEPNESSSDIAAAVALADAVTHELMAEQLGWFEQLDDQVAADAGERLGLDREELRVLAEARLHRVGVLFEFVDDE